MPATWPCHRQPPDPADATGIGRVHLTDGARNVRKARKDLGADAIVGAFCKASRHEGMTAGEAGADYASFGPIGVTSLGDGNSAPFELFEWWSEVIEVPIIAEGALTAELVAKFAPSQISSPWAKRSGPPRTL